MEKDGKCDKGCEKCIGMRNSRMHAVVMFVMANIQPGRIFPESKDFWDEISRLLPGDMGVNTAELKRFIQVERMYPLAPHSKGLIVRECWYRSKAAASAQEILPSSCKEGTAYKAVA